MDLRVDWRTTVDSLRKQPEQSKKNGYIRYSFRNVGCEGFWRHGGGRPKLRLIRDQFIAGHSNCDLRRHLDSVSPETPIRDIVDRCRVWESHADPASRRLTKQNPYPIYPAYVVGEADYNTETTRVAEVTGQNSESHQLRDLLRRVLSTEERRYRRSRNCYSS